MEKHIYFTAELKDRLITEQIWNSRDSKVCTDETKVLVSTLNKPEPTKADLEAMKTDRLNHTLEILQKYGPLWKLDPDTYGDGLGVAWFDDNQVATLQEKIGYVFKNRTLLNQAFTHSSARTGSKDDMDNEVFEFIGDRILDMLVTKKLVSMYGKYKYDEPSQYLNFINEFNPYITAKSEGKLTKLKIAIVEQNALAELTVQHGFHEYLITGKSDKDKTLKDQASVQENLFEAILGAVTIDCNWDMDILENVLFKLYDIDAKIDNMKIVGNYIEKVQEWYQHNYPGTLPEYIIEEQDDGTFDCTLELPIDFFRQSPENASSYALSLAELDGELCFSKNAHSIKAAKLLVAQEFYKYLESTNAFCTNIVKEVGEPNVDRAINQVQELYQKGILKKVEYKFNEVTLNKETWWYCNCDACYYFADVCATSKKDAKKHAAFLLLNKLTCTPVKNDENSEEEFVAEWNKPGERPTLTI